MNKITHLDLLNRWKYGCGASECQTVKNVVLGRGTFPCDVLFVGEAPGRTEDDNGDAFSGPAGIFLEDDIIAPAEKDARVSLSKGFTNMVGCIPLGEDGNKRLEPTNECIKSCTPRLLDTIRLFRPKLIVEVGKIAEKKLKKAMESSPDTEAWLQTMDVQNGERCLGCKSNIPCDCCCCWYCGKSYGLTEGAQKKHERTCSEALMRKGSKGCEVISITHPSAILQAHAAQQPLFIHKAIVTLIQAFIDLGDKIKKH